MASDADQQLRLALEPHSADRRMVCVDETDTAKGDAVLSFYMRRAFADTDGHVCLVGVRDSYGHYQNLGLRSGYNLLSMANRGRFTFVEPDGGASANRLVECARDLLLRHPDGDVHHMLVDDLGTLLLLGERLEDLVDFLAYARRQPRLSLVFGCRKHPADAASQRLAAAAAYVANVRVALAPLPTGFCDAATGTMTVTRAGGVHGARYLYKLVDRGLALTLKPNAAR